MAFARVRSFDVFARRGLPSLPKFLKFRERPHHKHRVEYDVRMGELREEFMRTHGISPNEEIELHKAHIKEKKMDNFGRGPTECEIKERTESLKRRGVLGPTPEVISYCAAEKSGAGANQSSVFRNFAGGICASRRKIIGH